VGAVDVYLFFHRGKDEFRIARIDGDVAGLCGAYCTVTIEGQTISKLTPGQRLAVYGPHTRLIGGTWSETPIAIVRVLRVDEQTAFAQVLLVHEAADTDDSRRLKTGLRVSSKPEFVTDFLVPAFGDGYVHQDYTVHLRPGTVARVGDHSVTLKPQIRGQRIIDHLVGETKLQITALGQEGISAQTTLVSGLPPMEGDIVQLVATQGTLKE
jgi:hypothetical protein